MFSDTHLFPIYDRATNDSIAPIAAFVAKKIIGLKNSFATSSDADEQNEIIAYAVIVLFDRRC
jgi:hypothetical protein